MKPCTQCGHKNNDEATSCISCATLIGKNEIVEKEYETPRSNLEREAHPHGNCVSINFARTLERELIASQELIEKLVEAFYELTFRVKVDTIISQKEMPRSCQASMFRELYKLYVKYGVEREDSDIHKTIARSQGYGKEKV